jgi:hydrogenase maturation protease
MAAEGTLLIGIGNPLRGDDGVGGFLVEELARELAARAPRARPSQGPQWRSAQQLTPELAPLVASADLVLVVDAWAAPGSARPWIETLLARDAPMAPVDVGSHGLDPLALLTIAWSLYGWRGEGALLRVPAHAFPHGSRFSAPLRRSLPEARQLMRRWLRERG